MLTPSNRCISVALCIASQLVASIRQEADPAAQSLRFHRALLAANKHKRSNRSDETKRKNRKEKKKKLAIPGGVHKAAMVGEQSPLPSLTATAAIILREAADMVRFLGIATAKLS